MSRYARQSRNIQPCGQLEPTSRLRFKCLALLVSRPIPTAFRLKSPYLRANYFRSILVASCAIVWHRVIQSFTSCDAKMGKEGFEPSYLLFQ